jgi:hypothetical protein
MPGRKFGRQPDRIDPRALLFAFRRLVIGPGSSVRGRSPVSAGSAFADELLLCF